MLDAVGAGELPDAADYGDEGSDTLGNVARAVGGLDLPTLEALGLGNIEPLEGCAPQPGAPAIAGRLAEAVARDPALGRGVNVIDGRITYEAVADAHGLDYTPLADVLPLAAV